MDKNDLADQLSLRLRSLTKRDAERVIEALFDDRDGLLRQALVAGEPVALRGFGTFEVRRRAPRVARNPRTGEPVDVPAKKAPAFKPSVTLKRALND